MKVQSRSMSNAQCFLSSDTARLPIRTDLGLPRESVSSLCRGHANLHIARPDEIYSMPCHWHRSKVPRRSYQYLWFLRQLKQFCIDSTAEIGVIANVDLNFTLLSGGTFLLLSACAAIIFRISRASLLSFRELLSSALNPTAVFLQRDYKIILQVCIGAVNLLRLGACVTLILQIE